MTEVFDPMLAPHPPWPWLAAAREPWIAYQYGDRDPVVKERAAEFDRWLARLGGRS